MSSQTIEQVGPIIEEKGFDLTLSEKLKFAETPINVRVPLCKEVFQNMVQDHVNGRIHNLFGGLEGQAQYEVFLALRDLRQKYEAAAVEFIRDAHKLDIKDFQMPPLTIDDVEPLEQLHNLSTTYLWLSYRLPLSFPDPEPVRKFKTELELALEFVLEIVATSEGGDRTKGAVVKRLEKRLEDRRIAEKNRIKYVTRGEIDNSAILDALVVPAEQASNLSELV